jgi:hypothetical protein
MVRFGVEERCALKAEVDKMFVYYFSYGKNTCSTFKQSVYYLTFKHEFHLNIISYT